jgi:hypothetical protein
MFFSGFRSGDLDLFDIGGPTGYGLYTVEDGVKKYQSRNGLEVDGWMKPGGPTIVKMKEQLGGLLSGYPAPTPEQVDQHHRLRTEGKDGLLNVELPALSLKGNPSLPPVDKSTRGSNESWVNWMTRHQKGLGGAPDMLATYIKNFGIDGVVQARDFVEQWDKAVPGEGATAIRAILSLLSDPAQQRAFLGGDLPKGTPFGVLKPDDIPIYNHVMAPERSARDSADDEKPRWVYDPETGNAGWVVPKNIQLMSSNEATDQVQADKSGRDASEINQGMLAPFLDRRDLQVGAGVQVAQNSGTMSDADPAEMHVADAGNAQRQTAPPMGPTSRNPQPKRIETPSAPPPIPSPIPSHRTEEFKSPDMQARWKAFNEAAEALPNAGKNERAVYATLFADEGGDKVNAANGASAGITNTTLDRLRGEGRLGDLPADIRSAQLGTDDKAAVMRAAMDSAFQFYNKEPGAPPSANNNGHKIFETLTPEAGGVLGSTMYMHGGPSGARIVQNAINKVLEEKPGGGVDPQKVDGKFGTDTRNAYHRLSTDPERRQALYDAIAEGRRQNLIQIRTTTDNEGNRIPGKVEGGETKLIERYRVIAAR